MDNPLIKELRSKLKKASEYTPKTSSRSEFNKDAFVKAARELQKTLRPEEVLLDAPNKHARSC